MFFCDPPGDTTPQSLMNRGSSVSDLHYIFFHDQEPIHLDVHEPLFSSVVRRNGDLNFSRGGIHSAVVTSEYCSDAVAQVCSQYGWRDYYYFFHGWAALDWYRGYDRAFLIPPPEQRKITHSFVSANRIIGGRRDHRVLLMYHLLKSGVKNAHISFPHTCPVENIPVTAIAEPYQDQYPDIVDTFNKAVLPMNFAGETGHPMESCWLSLFNECRESLAYVITETVCTGTRNHLTEKTFKPICLRMPFVMLSTAGSLAYLRKYGFRTFDTIWDESYDLETDDAKRIEKVGQLLSTFDAMSPSELQQVYNSARDIVEHNYQHFYSGAFEQVLWDELSAMLNQIQQDFKKC